MSRLIQIKTYTPEQVAEIYQISKNTVYKMINDGSIAAKRIGKSFRIPQSELNWVISGIDSDLEDLEKVDLEILKSGAAETIKQARKELNKNK